MGGLTKGTLKASIYLELYFDDWLNHNFQLIDSYHSLWIMLILFFILLRRDHSFHVKGTKLFIDTYG